MAVTPLRWYWENYIEEKKTERGKENAGSLNKVT
jgi:hypothetical protein